MKNETVIEKLEALRLHLERVSENSRRGFGPTYYDDFPAIDAAIELLKTLPLNASIP